jgi:hypothetical protein
MNTLSIFVNKNQRLLLCTSLLLMTASIVLAALWLKTGEDWYEPIIVVLTTCSTLIGVPTLREWWNTKTHPGDGLTTWEGTLPLHQTGASEIEVFYPKPFVRNPLLSIVMVDGRNNYTIGDQRPDGFVIVRGGASSWNASQGLDLHWQAKGATK